MLASFGLLNSVILGVYLLGMVLIGFFFMRRQDTTEEYFLASRTMPWIPVAMSMFASLTSAVTFMGLPAQAFRENVSLLMVCIVSPLLVPVLVLVLYPAYRRHGVTTSYEFIGLRFGRAGRTAVASLFILARLGWMGTVIYAPALALSVVTDLPLALSILLMGGMATLYTALGGLAAVIWTDVVQFIILVAGAIWLAADLIVHVPDGVGGILRIASDAGHLHVARWRMSLVEMSGLAVAVSFFLQMMQDYGTDQVTVQRMLAIRKNSGVTKATLFNACTDVFMIALLLFIGLGLFAFYQVNPALAPTGSADTVLPHYIIRSLPNGISGLLVSAIFAAAMSSMDSGINSLATVIEHDFIKLFRHGARSERHDVRQARLLTIALGIVATGMAFGITRMGSIIEAFATFMGLFNAPVLALFLLGFVSERARFSAWCAGVPLAVLATLAAKYYAGIHWVYFFPLSFSISFTTGWLLSAFRPRQIVRAAGLSSLAILAAGVIASGGCARHETPVQQGDRDGILHFGNLSEPAALDPQVVTGVSEHNIISALLEGLVAEDPATLDPVPGVAESWEVSANARRYTFHLRPDARWSNGDPVTASDFVFSYRRILTPSLGAPYAYMLFCIEGAEAYNKGELADFDAVGVKALKEHTLEITLHEPVPYFLAMLNHYSWFPVHPPTILAHGGIGDIGTAWTTPGHFTGNGPFVLTDWRANKHIIVSRSATYWDRDRVRLNAIHFYPIGDQSIEERAFRAGQLHVTGTIPADRIDHYRETAPGLLHLDPYLGCYYYLFNTRRPPLDKPAVRRALALAVDRDRITRHITRAGEVPAFHFTPPGTGGYTAEQPLTGTLDEARRLMAEAGFPGGKGFPTLTVLYNTADAHARIAEAIQQMWKQELGIDIELVNMEWKVYIEQTQNGQYDIARAGWIGDYPDPNTFLDLWVTGGGNNRSGWSNPAYDALIRQAAQTPENTRRHALFQEAEGILMKETPILPIYFYRSKSLVQPSVQGWMSNLLDHHPWKHISLSPP
jgi:oligopeptide transport system substrate-binding protein